MAKIDAVKAPRTQDGASRFEAVLTDVEATGAGTLAGRYLRRFWQPIQHSAEIRPGQAAHVRAMSEDFTLYRGESGALHLIDHRCPHRQVPLHIGSVEGEEIRCMFHGWKFDGTGQCVQQPSERPPFSHKVKLRSYPVREYLGLVFAYLGDGEAPAFPRYPEFEAEDIVINLDSYTRPCNYFNNLENSGDKTHVAFLHRSFDAAWDETTDGMTLTAAESVWGVSWFTERPSGKRSASHFGMPNIYHSCSVPEDAGIPYREFIVWWVPIDDDRHTQFTVVKLPRNAPGTAGYQQRRAERNARCNLDREQLARDLLSGKLRWSDVDGSRVNMLWLQDDVAQMGIGRISERGAERLGRGDRAVILLRQVWLRELGRLARNEPLKPWRYAPEELVAHAAY